jgi:hypothetical protein
MARSTWTNLPNVLFAIPANAIRSTFFCVSLIATALSGPHLLSAVLLPR